VPLLLLFATTLFVSAFLLFLIQPMIAQMILPLLGGTPQVWNTCMVFFQAALLAGYGYTHSTSTYMPTKRQTMLHVGLLLLPFLFFVLPFSIGTWTPAIEVNPIWSVLYILLLTVGLPFFVVATSAPLLQRWFASTGHRAAKDPYFLYGASNLGSMLALPCYLIVVQPLFDLQTQTMIWTVGYALMIVMVSTCALVVWKAPRLVTLPEKVLEKEEMPDPLVQAPSVEAPSPVAITAAAPAPAAPQQQVTRRAGRRYRPRQAVLAPVASHVTAAAPQPAAAPVQGSNWELFLRLLPVALGSLAAGGLLFLLAEWLPSIGLLMVETNTSIQMGMRIIAITWAVGGVVLLVLPWITNLESESTNITAITIPMRIRWVLLAAAPSSLMLGVTTYMTTDIAAVPVFWAVPLELYLLSFILVFARWPVPWTGTPHRVMIAIQPLGLLIAGVIVFGSWNTTLPWVMFTHLAAFFLCVMVCHGELARERPPVKYLTEFYLWMAVGGVVGGLFNAMIAPLIFTQVIEYLLVVIAVLFLRSQVHFANLVRLTIVLLAVCLINIVAIALLQQILGRSLNLIDLTLLMVAEVAVAVVLYKKRFFHWVTQNPDVNEDHTTQEYLLDLGYASCLALLGFALLRLSLSPKLWPNAEGLTQFLMIQFHNWFNMERVSAWTWARWGELILIEGIPMAICLGFAGRPLRLGLAVVGLFAANYFMLLRGETNFIYENRSFFSVQRVRVDDKRGENGTGPGLYHVLIHGGIDHGRQNLAPGAAADRAMAVSGVEWFHPDNKRDQPISYFWPTNPIGQIYYQLRQSSDKPAPFAVVGLGVGTLASYAKPGQTVHFYEIDPAVLRLSGYEIGANGQLSQLPGDPYFYYLQDAKKRGVDLKVFLGDGRLKIMDAEEHLYKIISLDAFSSDAIPVHLMTKEAVKIYLSKLLPDGVLIFNITNRYVELAPTLADVAKEFDLVCLHQDDDYDSRIPDKFGSDWVIMFRKRPAAAQLAAELDVKKKASIASRAADPKAVNEAGESAARAARKEMVADAAAVVASLQPALLPAVPAGGLVVVPMHDFPQRKDGAPYLTQRINPWRWTRPQPTGQPPWRDSYSNLLRVMRW
jgi:hypothetical protein